MRTCLLVLVAGCFAGSSSMTPKAPADLATLGAPGLRAIDAARWEGAVKYLASDELAGRQPGTDGDRKAEDYIADQYKAIGLEPRGENGTYFQTIPFCSASLDEANSSLVVHAKAGDVPFSHMKDALIWGDCHGPDIAIDAPLVFVGYGMTTNGYDDLTGLSLHGAVAVIFSGAPRAIGGRSLDAAEHAVLSDTKKRTVALRDHGASAVITIYDPSRAERMPFDMYLPKAAAGGQMAWLENGKVGSLPALPLVTTSEAVLDKLLPPGAPRAHEIWQRLDRGELQKVELGAAASLKIRSRITNVTACNVIGVLPGKEPNEVVVYSAHHDHLGIGPEINGDRIYNGALDNASGTAGIIEIARAFAALPDKPSRSIAFVAVTAEEKGLLGSDYFVMHPTIPLDRIVADINLDGITPYYEHYDVVGLGAEHSTLASHVAAAAKATGLVVSEDPDPQQVLFIRSDQYSFVKKGIPSVFPGAGEKDAHGDTRKYRELNDKWVAEHYHRPSDEWHAEDNAQWAARELQFDFLLGLSVANAAERPHWNPGDPFAALK